MLNKNKFHLSLFALLLFIIGNQLFSSQKVNAQDKPTEHRIISLKWEELSMHTGLPSDTVYDMAVDQGKYIYALCWGKIITRYTIQDKHIRNYSI